MAGMCTSALERLWSSAMACGLMRLPLRCAAVPARRQLRTSCLLARLCAVHLSPAVPHAPRLVDGGWAIQTVMMEALAVTLERQWAA